MSTVYASYRPARGGWDWTVDVDGQDVKSGHTNTIGCAIDDAQRYALDRVPWWDVFTNGGFGV